MFSFNIQAQHEPMHATYVVALAFDPENLLVLFVGLNVYLN